MGNKGTVDLQTLPRFGDELGRSRRQKTAIRPVPARAASRQPVYGGVSPASPWGTLSSGGESQHGLGGILSSSLSGGTFPLPQPVPGWDGDPGARLCEGGPCLWLFSPYLVRELHATFLAPPGASKRRPGAEEGEAGTGPAPGWDQPPLLVPATARPRCLAKAPRRLVPQPRPTGSGSPAKRWVPPAPRLCWPQLLLVKVDALSPAALAQCGAPLWARGVSVRVGVTVRPQSWRGQVDSWGWCLSWCHPRLCCAYPRGLGEGETESQQGLELTSLAQGREHERGI